MASGFGDCSVTETMCEQTSINEDGENYSENYSTDEIDETNEIEKTNEAIIFAIAEEAMQQEKDRTEALISKAERIIQYIMAIIGVVNPGIVFLQEKLDISKEMLICSMVWINIPFLISLFLAILSQNPMKKFYFPSGIDAIIDINSSQIITKKTYINYQLDCMEMYTSALRQSNSTRVRCILLSNISLLLGFVMILIQGYWLLGNDDLLVEVLRYYGGLVLLLLCCGFD